MSKQPNTSSPKDPKRAKQERLEKALRANLARRKQASGERKAADGDG